MEVIKVFVRYRNRVTRCDIGRIEIHCRLWRSDNEAVTSEVPHRQAVGIGYLYLSFEKRVSPS
jgi:hypothetical protein